MIAYIFVNTSVWMYYYSDDLPRPAEATEGRDLADWTHDGRCHIQPLNLQVGAASGLSIDLIATLRLLPLPTSISFRWYRDDRCTQWGVD